jgi:hypothetical protein
MGPAIDLIALRFSTLEALMVRGARSEEGRVGRRAGVE